jgi:hypothetical protein
MKTKTLSKLTLNQESIRNLTEIQPDPGFALTHNKCPTFGFPVCTPVDGIN